VCGPNHKRVAVICEIWVRGVWARDGARDGVKLVAVRITRVSDDMRCMDVACARDGVKLGVA